MTVKHTCNVCIHNAVCDHNKFGFENCNSFIPEIGNDEIALDFCGVLCEYAESIINKAEAKAIHRFVDKLKENARIEIMHRPRINLHYELKFVYIDDVEKLAQETVGGAK